MLTCEVMRDRVHVLLGQSPSDTTNYVSSARIIDWLNEGIHVLCSVGKVYDLTKDVSASNGVIPFSALDTDVAYCIEISDVFDNGTALNKIDKAQAGKMFQSGTDPLWWYEFADRIFLIPPASKSLTVHYFGLPKGNLVVAPATAPNFNVPPFNPKYHVQLVNYAAWRGKQVYQQHQEAGISFLQAFAQSINMDVAELQERIGLPNVGVRNA